MLFLQFLAQPPLVLTYLRPEISQRIAYQQTMDSSQQSQQTL